jgi:hypothetical protein
VPFGFSMRITSPCSRLEGWELPKVANESSVGIVEGELAWEGDSILYRVILGSFARMLFEGTPGRATLRVEEVPLGVPGPNRGHAAERILTNVPLDQPFPKSPTPSRWRVRLDQNPLQYAYPIDNQIIVERTGGGG